MLRKIFIFLFSCFFIVACDSTTGPNETGGTFIGAATGALIGSQFGKGDGQLAAVAIGTLAGAYIGGQVGKRMDEQDRRLANQTTYNTLENYPDNKSGTWHNPNKDHYGSVVVTETHEYPSDNKVCRDYVHTVTIDGEQEKVYGRACRDMRDTKGQWYDAK